MLLLKTINPCVKEQEGQVSPGHSPELFGSRFKRTHCQKARTILVDVHQIILQEQKEYLEHTTDARRKITRCQVS